MKDSKNYNTPKNSSPNLPSLKASSWVSKAKWPPSAELSVKCNKNFLNKLPKTTNWQFTKARPLSSLKRKNNIRISSNIKKKKCLDCKPKFVKSKNKSTKLKALASKKINFKIIWANSNKKNPNTQNVNNKLSKLSGRPQTCPELNKSLNSKNPDTKNLFALSKAKDSLPTSQSKTLQLNK